MMKSIYLHSRTSLPYLNQAVKIIGKKSLSDANVMMQEGQPVPTDGSVSVQTCVSVKAWDVVVAVSPCGFVHAVASRLSMTTCISRSSK